MKQNGDTLVLDTLYGEKTMAVADALAERCAVCKSKKFAIYDELDRKSVV